MTRKVLAIDHERCTGCRACEALCSITKFGEVNPARGHIQVLKTFHGGIDLPWTCMQCEDAPCERACLMGAISRRAATGALVIDQNRCIGCRICVYSCPFGCLHVDPVGLQVGKCDLCGGDPQCVTLCATKALRYERVDRLETPRRLQALQMVTELAQRAGAAHEGR